MPIEWQRSDSALSLVLSHRKKRCADFIDLKKLVSLAEAWAKQDPKRISGTPFLYGEPGASSKKASDVHQSPQCWANCVRILSYTYVLVSAADKAESEWCAMDGVLQHVNTVEQYARWDSKSTAGLHPRLIEAESTIRHEWHRLMQQDRSISLEDAIELYCFVATKIEMVMFAQSLVLLKYLLLLGFAT